MLGTWPPSADFGDGEAELSAGIDLGVDGTDAAAAAALGVDGARCQMLATCDRVGTAGLKVAANDARGIVPCLRVGIPKLPD